MMLNIYVIAVLFAKKQGLSSPEKSLHKACLPQYRIVITDLFYVKKEIHAIVVLEKGK